MAKVVDWDVGKENRMEGEVIFPICEVYFHYLFDVESFSKYVNPVLAKFDGMKERYNGMERNLFLSHVIKKNSDEKYNSSYILEFPDGTKFPLHDWETDENGEVEIFIGSYSIDFDSF